MGEMRVKDVSIRAHNEILMKNREAALQIPGIDNRIRNLVIGKFKLGDKDKHSRKSTWGTFCAIECLLRYLYFGDVGTAIELQSLLRKHGMDGNCAAENYTFGCEATFDRTVSAHGNLESDYKRVLDGCTVEDSLEKVISRLYQFTLPDKQDSFRDVAQHVFGVRV